MLTEEEIRHGLTLEMKKQRDLLWDYTHPFYKEIIKLDHTTPKETIQSLLLQWLNEGPLEKERSRMVVVKAACRLIKLRAENIVLGYLAEGLEDLIRHRRNTRLYSLGIMVDEQLAPHEFPKNNLFHRRIEVCTWLLTLPPQAGIINRLIKSWAINAERLLNTVVRFGEKQLKPEESLDIINTAQRVINVRLDSLNVRAEIEGSGKKRTKRAPKRKYTWGEIWLWPKNTKERVTVRKQLELLKMGRSTIHDYLSRCAVVGSGNQLINGDELKKLMRDKNRLR